MAISVQSNKKFFKSTRILTKNFKILMIFVNDLGQ